jgi:hypothetical protein
MRAIRRRWALWLLAAGCWLAPGAAWCQDAAPAGKDAALLDAMAVLFLNAEAGRPGLPQGDPVRREAANGAIAYTYVGPSLFYGATDAEYRDRAASKYQRRHGVLRLAQPCVIRLDDTLDYSLKDSRAVFGQAATTSSVLVDLRDYRHFDFKMSGRTDGSVTIGGKGVVCALVGAARACVDDYFHPLFFNGAPGSPQSEVDAFAAARGKAADVIKATCPPRPG